MFRFDVNDAVFLEQKETIEKALSSNPKTEKMLRNLIRRVIFQARAETMQNIQFKYGDPREAVKSVRTSVYRKVLGGNINIYNSRKRHESSGYEPPRKQRSSFARGGNRHPRSARTQQIMDYGPMDRGFILRFVNSGTNRRISLGGNRGRIAGNLSFTSSSESAMNRAVDTLSTLIDNELENILNKNT